MTQTQRLGRISAALRAGGHSLTKPRHAIAAALIEAHGPRSAAEVHAAVGAHGIDLVTVYRTLKLLESLHLVEPVGAGETTARYCLVEPGHHHHHLICRGCGRIEEVELCGLDEQVEAEVARRTHFRVEGHRLEFTGLCAGCQ